MDLLRRLLGDGAHDRLGEQKRPVTRQLKVLRDRGIPRAESGTRSQHRPKLFGGNRMRETLAAEFAHRKHSPLILLSPAKIQ